MDRARQFRNFGHPLGHASDVTVRIVLTLYGGVLSQIGGEVQLCVTSPNTEGSTMAELKQPAQGSD